MNVELPAKNQFRNHYLAFRDKLLSLFELELICFAWSYKNSALWDEMLVPTEPFIHYNEKEAAFKTRKKNWEKSLRWIKIKNFDNKIWLKEVKRALWNPELDMLDQEKYNKGLKLFEIFKEELF